MTRSIFRGIAILSAFAGVVLGSTGALAASTATTTVNYGCVTGCTGTYAHTYTVTLNCDGTFAGTGFWAANPSLTENITGKVGPGNKVHYTSVYNWFPYSVTVDGRLNLRTHALDGTATSSTGQTFTVTSTSITMSLDLESCEHQLRGERGGGD